MFAITFLYPRYLLFLFLIPLFIFIHFATLKATKSTALKFANFESIAKIRGVDFFSKNLIILFLSTLIIFLLIMSVSGMVFHTTIEASKHPFVIALDNSQSMEADDIIPNRMESAKKIAIEFVQSTPVDTEIAVMSFSGSSIIEQELTDNKELVKDAIKRIGISGIAGTDIYEVAITGTNLLKGRNGGAIILLSDGQINVGSIGESAAYANKNNAIVHTIAFGTEEGGTTSYGISKVDEDSLKALSYNTQGEFFRAINENELEESFKNAVEKTVRKVSIELSSYLLAIAIILFSLEYFLINSRYKRLI